MKSNKMIKPFAYTAAYLSVILTLGVVAEAREQPYQLRRLVTTQNDATGSEFVTRVNDESGAGLPDKLPGFEDPENTNISNGNGSPPAGGFDWGLIGGGSSSFQDFDWGNMDWSNEDWQAFLDNLGGMLDFCPILESVMGISQDFAVAGNCSCDGNFMAGLAVQCRYEECPESNTCGSVGLNFTTEGKTGLINTSFCVDFAADQYEEVCFSYQVDRIGQSSANDFEPTCFATYGGNPCGCKIENFCFTVDCSAFLPGAVMDTCQYLNFNQNDDTKNLFPNFPIFDESFDGTYAFENINWTNLDWHNIDWTNFNFDRIDWHNADLISTQWGSLFGDTLPSDICSILSAQIVRMDDTVYLDRCTCESDSETGFKLQCLFNDQCLPESQGDAVSQGSLSAPNTLCGDITMEYKFDVIGSIGGSLCVDFKEDVHPTTCIEYSIPFASQESSPTCEATYGGKNCKCNIEDTLCVTIDCSEHEPTAVTTSCQNFDVTSQENVPELLPRFGVPVTASGDTAGSTNEASSGSQDEPDDVADGSISMDPLQPIAENLEGESSSSSIQPSRELLGALALIGSIFFVLE